MMTRTAILPRSASGVPRDLHASFIHTACALLIVAVVGTAALYGAGPSLPRYYLIEQDVPLLLLAAGGLWGLALIREDRPEIAPAAMAARWPLILTAVLFCYIGAHWLLGAYPVSRDEILADFQGAYLARGQLGRPIPRALHDIAEAAMPLWTAPWITRGYWVGDYLPVNSLLRGVMARLGDARLTSPLLLLAGSAALWSAARRIWPATPRPALVALVLALTSTQVLATAMTAYAMTAHFAFNALWLACFLRGGRAGHAAALTIGLLATGLHQVQFHLLFVAGIIGWAWLAGRRRIALVYAAACLGYLVVWMGLYPRMLVATLGAPPAVLAPAPLVTGTLGKLGRLRDWEPLTSITRFVAWQNVLLVPLALAGLRATRADDHRPTILWGIAASCLIGLATTVLQGHGYGYRYLHGAIPAFCLLAAGGWMRLEKEAGRALPAALLWGSAAFALLVTMPFALWQSHRFVAPYAAAYRAVRAAPADIVLVDTRAGAFIQDIVRLNSAAPRPLVLDLAYVPSARIDRWCRDGTRVMLFAGREARALDVMPTYQTMVSDPVSAERRDQLDRLGCAARVPLTDG